jgi:hypothetical protein
MPRCQTPPFKIRMVERSAWPGGACPGVRHEQFGDEVVTELREPCPSSISGGS